ncbi:MAG: hypothetical protein AAF327_21180 [Cyanobacteria bacterium P01_A01_bin.37]
MGLERIAQGMAIRIGRGPSLCRGGAAFGDNLTEFRAAELRDPADEIALYLQIPWFKLSVAEVLGILKYMPVNLRFYDKRHCFLSLDDVVLNDS